MLPDILKILLPASSIPSGTHVAIPSQHQEDQEDLEYLLIRESLFMPRKGVITSDVPPSVSAPKGCVFLTHALQGVITVYPEDSELLWLVRHDTLRWFLPVLDPE